MVKGRGWSATHQEISLICSYFNHWGSSASSPYTNAKKWSELRHELDGTQRHRHICVLLITGRAFPLRFTDFIVFGMGKEVNGVSRSRFEASSHCLFPDWHVDVNILSFLLLNAWNNTGLYVLLQWKRPSFRNHITYEFSSSNRLTVKTLSLMYVDQRQHQIHHYIPFK